VRQRRMIAKSTASLGVSTDAVIIVQNIADHFLPHLALVPSVLHG